MDNGYYPWDGDFTPCKSNSCVAVVILNFDYIPPKKVAIYGPLKTENIGIEKIVANIISNPNIRYLIICGDDIRGHCPGSTLIALKKNGIDEKNRIVDAQGAIPFIENLKKEAIERFRSQIMIIDLIGLKDKKVIEKEIDKCIKLSTPSFGKPYIAIRIKPELKIKIEDKRVIHSKIMINYLGKIKKRGK